MPEIDAKLKGKRILASFRNGRQHSHSHSHSFARGLSNFALERRTTKPKREIESERERENAEQMRNSPVFNTQKIGNFETIFCSLKYDKVSFPLQEIYFVNRAVPT